MASRPNSGSSRIALAYGVRTRVTATLNSDIISGITALDSTPFSLAIDFCNEPRWSMAAAEMTPFLLATALSLFSFPSVIFTAISFSSIQYEIDQKRQLMIAEPGVSSQQ